MNTIFLGSPVIRLPVPNVIVVGDQHDFIRMLRTDLRAFGVFMTKEPQVGYDTTRAIRAARVGNPLYCLMYGPLADHAMIATILDAGADQVDMFPVDGKLFKMQLEAIRRRGFGNPDPIIKMGRLTYDKNVRTLVADGQRVHLTELESNILYAIIAAQGRTLSKKQILDAVYGFDDEDGVHEKIVDVVVCKVRRKMMQMSGGFDFIKTIWGSGYAFVEEGFVPNIRNTVAGQQRFEIERGPVRANRHTQLPEAAE